MKKNIFAKLITMVLIAALMAATVCGCSSVAEATETSAAEGSDPVSEKSVASSKDYAEWSLDEIAAFSAIISGITDREYAAGEGANYVIYEDVQYDDSIVGTVLFNTASVRFDTVGEYDMAYWVYFDMSALAEWMAANDMEEAYAGLDSGADVLAVSVRAVVTVTEAVEEEEGEEAETADGSAVADSSQGADAASSTSVKSASSASKSSGSSSCDHNWVQTYSASSKGNVLICDKCGAVKNASGSSSSQSCNHDWVEQGYYEDVLVSEGYYECKVCGYKSYDKSQVEMARHVNAKHDGMGSSTWVYAKYNSVWYSTGYKCSKCGATK